MTYRTITPPDVEPVSVDEAALHCRVDSDDRSEYLLLDAWITAARERAEHYAGRSFAQSELQASFPGFPAGSSPLVLPIGPAASVQSIVYDDENGSQQSLNSGDFELSLFGQSRQVFPTADTWPTTNGAPHSVRVNYQTRDECPAAARAAMLLAVGSLYENRQEVVASSAATMQELPQGFFALLDTVKVWSA